MTLRRSVLATTLTGGLLVVGLVVLAYHQAPRNSFHFDDLNNIEGNGAVRVEQLSLDNLLGAARDSPLDRRGLAYITFAIDWWRGGGEPSAFQQTNVALHAANALLVFAVLLVALGGLKDRSDGSTWLAGTAGAAIWAVHPIQVQAVTYIVQRMALLAAFFVLLSVLLFVLGRRSPRRAVAALLFALSALAMVCGAFCKENAWVAPALVVLAEYGLVRREGLLLRSRMETIAVGSALSLALLVFAVTLMGIGPLHDFVAGAYDHRDFTMIERVLTQPRVVLFHLWQMLLPLPGRFSLEHDFSTSTSLLSPVWTLPALLIILGWCLVGLRLVTLRRARVAGFFALWAPATLLIESSIAPLEMVFEHRMYLPSVGLVGLLACLVARATGRGGAPRTAVGLALALVVGLLVGSTLIRVPVWRTELSLATDSVRNAPRSSRAWSMFGLSQLRAGNVTEARPALSRSLELNPEDRLALEFMGVILMDEGRLDEAARNLRRAHRAAPRRPSVLNHLGELHLKRKEFSEADEMFRRAITIRPWVPTYH